MKCIKCGETRESEFYLGKYKESWCKVCHREYGREYMRNHPEMNKEGFKRWYTKNAETQYEGRIAYVHADSQRHRAQTYAYRKFPKAQVCELIGCEELGERHHDDYSKPYEIRWLCRKHHKILHRKYMEEIVV